MFASFNLILLLAALFGCATKTEVVKVPEPIKQPRSWSDKKRNCHSFYLNQFGLNPNEAIGICKEELGRRDN